MKKTLKEEQLSRVSGGVKVSGGVSTILGYSITANPPSPPAPPEHDGADRSFRDPDA